MTSRILAANFAIGALSRRERQDVARQRLSDPELDAQIDEHEAMMAPLAGVSGEIEPPPALRDRVLAAVLAADRFQSEGKLLTPLAGGNWKNVFPGIDMKRLWARGPKLMRCAPGSIVPAHEHHRVEHLVVLSGDFVLDGRRFATGDHLNSPAGSCHGAGVTSTGCILLISDG